MTKTIEQLEVDNVVLREALGAIISVDEPPEYGRLLGPTFSEQSAAILALSTTDYSNKVVVDKAQWDLFVHFVKEYNDKANSIRGGEG